MKSLIFNIVKVLMFIVLQYCIIMGNMVFAYIAQNLYYSCEILYWIISVLAFLLGEGAIFVICTAKQPEKRGIHYHDEESVYHSTRRLLFNIMKLLMSIALQCYMILVIPLYVSDRQSFENTILNGLIILLGEGGIYLLYTMKPLEDKKQNKIYFIVYTGIHIIFFGVLLYGYFREML